MKYNIILIFIFSQISKSGWNGGDGDLDGDGENFLIGKCCENERTQSQHIQKPLKKKLGKISNVKFYTVDPYFGVIFQVERPKRAKNSTFGHFYTYKGGQGGTKACGPQNIVGHGQLQQKSRISDLLGPHNNFFRKKSPYLNNLSPIHIIKSLNWN